MSALLAWIIGFLEVRTSIHLLLRSAIALVLDDTFVGSAIQIVIGIPSVTF